MMIINEEEALERVNSPDNLCNKLLEIRSLYTNRNGRGFVPDKVKDSTAAMSKVIGQKAAGELIGVTQQSASYYNREGFGKDETAQIHEAALDAMLQSIQLIPEKLKTTKKATDLSTVAANLARVVEKTSTRIEETKLKVVVYAPRIRDENEYDEVING